MPFLLACCLYAGSPESLALPEPVDNSLIPFRAQFITFHFDDVMQKVLRNWGW